MTISKKQNLQELIRKASGWLEEVFMQTAPAETDQHQPPRCEHENMEWKPHRTRHQLMREGKIGTTQPLPDRTCSFMVNMNGVPPHSIKQAIKANNSGDRKLDCNSLADEPSAFDGNTKSPGHDIIKTRSGWTVLKPFRLRVNV